MKDLTTHRYTKLTVIKLDRLVRYGGKYPKTTAYWLCQCDCGKTVSVRAGHLTRGSTKSCGCLARAAARERLLTHGMSKTLTYQSYSSMLRRTVNDRHHRHPHYLGITVDERWLGPDGFINFFADMGERITKNMTIDRIDPALGYTPANCRWATKSQQMLNTGRNREDYQFYSSWSKPAVAYTLFKQRVKNGWNREKAISTVKMLR